MPNVSSAPFPFSIYLSTSSFYFL